MGRRSFGPVGRLEDERLAFGSMSCPTNVVMAGLTRLRGRSPFGAAKARPSTATGTAIL
jgi:hypothetical protein